MIIDEIITELNTFRDNGEIGVGLCKYLKDSIEQLRPYENYYNAVKALEAYTNRDDHDPFGDEIDRLESEVSKFDAQIQEQSHEPY